MAVASYGTMADPEDKVGNWQSLLLYDSAVTEDTMDFTFTVDFVSLYWYQAGSTVSVTVDAGLIANDGEGMYHGEWTVTLGSTVAGYTEYSLVPSTTFSIKRVKSDRGVQIKVSVTKTGQGAGESHSSTYARVPGNPSKTYRPPVVTISDVPQRIETLPLTVRWSVADQDGEIERLRFYIQRSMDGADVLEEFPPVGTTSRTLDIGDAVFEDGNTYRVIVNAYSSSGQTGSAIANVAASFTPLPPPSVSVSVDPAKASAAIDVTCDQATHHFDIYRDGERIMSGVTPGVGVVDAVPPLDVEVEWRVVAFSGIGASSQASASSVVPSGGYAYVNAGGAVAKLGSNAAPSESYTPERELYQAIGHRRPVAMYGEHVEYSGTLSGDVWWLEDFAGEGREASVEAWREVGEHRGPVTLRLPCGESHYAALDVKIDRGRMYALASVSASWTEVS